MYAPIFLIYPVGLFPQGAIAMRVGILSLLHESNTFIQTPTVMEMFERDGLLKGEAIYQAFDGGNHEISGFIEGLEEAGIEPVPVFYAATTPSGRITKATCDELMEMMFEAVDGAGEIDGWLVAPHGANAGEGDDYRDLDGYWLSRLRDNVGGEIPIVCTIDPHANLSPRMAKACDATIAYRSNPHMDQKVRGLEAAGLIARTLRGEIRPVQSASFPSVGINIERQLTSAEPCLPMYELANELLEDEKVLSNSVVLGFPYADVEEMGSAFVVVTDGDRELAKELVSRLSQYLVEHQKEFIGEYNTVENAVDRALAVEGPVCLLDMGDNVGGGSAGDGTTIAHELHRREEKRSYVCLYDPDSVEAARKTGIGGQVSLRMGGKTDDMHGSPLDAEVLIRSLHDGSFREPLVRHGGRTEFEMGLTAIVETDSGLTVALTSQRVVPVSLRMMTSCGLDPTEYQVIIAKGVHAPVAAYEPVCDELIRVDTIGSTAADMRGFDYEFRRHPMFPFEEIE